MPTFIERFYLKLPSKRELVPVYSATVFIIFTWVLYRLFWQIPSWLHDLNQRDVLILTFYVLAFALFESLSIMGIIILTSLIVPSKYFKDAFVVQGCTLLITITLIAIIIQRDTDIIFEREYWELLFWPLVMLVGVGLILILSKSIIKRWTIVTRFIEEVTQRMTVFLYLYIPLGLIGLIVVIFRNLF